MNTNEDDTATAEVVTATITDNRDVVREWLKDEPGSWGYLAGQAVLSLRRKLGRKLTEEERRQVWHALWGRLVGLKGHGP